MKMPAQEKSEVTVSIRPAAVQMLAPKLTQWSLKSAQNPDELGDPSTWWSNLHFDVSHGFGMAEAAGEQLPFGEMTLSLIPEKNPGRVLPYELSVTVAAVFQVPKDVPIDDQINHATVWGWSQLHGYLRAQVEALTLHARFGPWLPPHMQVTLVDLGALDAGVRRLRKDLGFDVVIDEAADATKRYDAIERALTLGRGNKSADELYAELLKLKEAVDALRNK
jgi:hypothetical protein